MSYCNSLTVVVSDITWFMAVEVDTAHISGFSLYLDCYWNLYAIIQLEWAGIRCAEHISCDRWSYHLNMYMIKDSDSPEKTVHIRQWVKRVHGPDIFMVNRDGYDVWFYYVCADWWSQNWIDPDNACIFLDTIHRSIQFSDKLFPFWMLISVIGQIRTPLWILTLLEDHHEWP